MAWDVNKIFLFTKFLLRKNQAGGVSATDLFYAWNSEQSAYHSDLLGRWQSKNNGKTGINTGLILNETVLGDLSPFVKKGTLPISSGLITKPSDFAFRLSARLGGKKVSFINHGQIDSVNGSAISPPSVASQKYFAVEYGNTYSLLPTTVTGNVELDYIAVPTDISWGYILDGNNRQVYNSATSVQPVWSQGIIVEITKRTLKSFGVSFKDQDFQNFGNNAIITGE